MNQPKKRLVFPLLIIGLLAIIGVSLSVGRFTVPLEQTVRILGSQFLPLDTTWTNSMENVIINVRLPRVIAGLIVGAALAASGATYQGIFKNPLVSPDLLGVSAGACAGASIAIVMHAGTLATQLMALGFGLLAVFMTTRIPHLFRNESTLMLILAGVVVGGFMNAVFGVMKYVADPDEELASIVYWTMGSFVDVRHGMLQALCPVMLLSLAALLLLRWRINLLSLGDAEASSLGVNVTALRGICIFFATLLTASAVCLSGTIGWVGLVTPHFARLLVGEDNRKLLPAAILIGAAMMTLVDWIARNLTGSEIPLSILTGVVGAPLFIILLMAQKRKIQ